MTLEFVDGFDVGDFDVMWLYVVADGGPASISSVVTPWGYGRSLFVPGGTEGVAGVPFTYLKRGIAASDQQIIGFNYRYAGSALSTDAVILTVFSGAGANMECALKMRTDGTLDLYDSRAGLHAYGFGAIASGPASAMLPGVWYFLEVKVSKTGAIVVRVNEAEKINTTGTLSGAQLDAISLNQTASHPNANVTPDQWFDDLSVCNSLDDGIGPANNDFLGICAAQTLKPNGVGTTTNLSPVPGAPNWDNVNDVPYSTADYNSSATTGNRDTYTLEDLRSDTSVVKGIQTVIIAQATDATAHVKAALRSGGSLYYDATVALDATPSVVSAVVREVDPATSAAWSVSGVNALEAGVEIA